MTLAAPGSLERLLVRATAGDATGLAALYASDAALHVNLPERSIRIDGHDAVHASLGSLFLPGRPGVLSSRAVPGGAIVRIESRLEDGTRRRRRHLVHVRDGTIALHVVLPERAPLPELPPLPDVRGLGLPRVVRRWQVEPGISGTLVERWKTVDGSVFFAKRLRPLGSWLQRATHDRGREAWLWRAGVLERVGAFVDHGVVGVIEHGGERIVVMRDLSTGLAPRRTSIAGIRRLAGAVAGMQAHVEPPSEGSLCTLEDRLLAFAPATAERERAGSDLAPKVIGRGWELLPRVVPDDVADALASALERPRELADRLRSHPASLVHGDLRPANAGFRGPRVTLIDWGLAAVAPPALDLTWLAFNLGTAHPGGPAPVLDAAIEGAARVDRDALRACLFATLVQAGCYFGFEAVMNPDPRARRNAVACLGWWIDRAREALAS